MIEGRLTPAGGTFARRLARHAAAIASARAESRRRARRGDPLRWRLARLLWPTFAKGP